MQPIKIIKLVEKFVLNTNADIKYIGDQAKYLIEMDRIEMPPRNKYFTTKTSTATESYYSTLLHELLHWTGHELRCSRKFSQLGENSNYAKEELIAELGAAFLCADLNITNTPRQDHAQYLNHWLTVIKEDPVFLKKSAALAEKGVDWLNSLQNDKSAS
ncbi:MAG: antirestriction protein [Candidatus Magnetoglobus multicellularis str. Araruama]|uniref:Antirestriction protein n=1 Tax=Candidatus Magnetoglobus multicellularis str. Araruama TaxID=890399 RepID=A0A1V1NUV0_9BACT|nr:MAG: antirestriction protein [Candidatus Magnetoglobus multicellularis str. Araruama]